uniref:Uncharacterized protein n=1 Tax=Panagrolaimus davidi TaxID=227884 RepID=A0A914PEF3_9BILA
MAILDGWDCIWIYDIAHAFNLDSTETKMNDPVNVVVLSTLIALEMFFRFPQSVVMLGRYIYATGEALKYLDFLMKDDDEKSIFSHEINSIFGTPEIADISALLRHCMDSGLGWLSAEKHGRMIHNHIIKTITYDEIPEYLHRFENYQLCQFIMNIICGENDGYAITEHFTLCNEENWKKLQKFLSIDIETRIRIISDYLDDRLIMLGNEIICDKTLKEFDIINKKRENIRENISDCVKWLSDFSEYVRLD